MATKKKTTAKADKGFVGKVADTNPNSAYTVAGVTGGVKPKATAKASKAEAAPEAPATGEGEANGEA